MLPPVVGIMGHARSGKDTAAAGLSALGFVRRSFAEPLKHAALVTLRAVMPVHADWIERYGWEWAKDELPWARPYLQAFGTDAIRQLDPTFWIRTALDHIDQAAVFPDCRFANEVQAIRDAGGMILRVDRPGTAPANSHVCETEWQTIVPDAVLHNDTSVDALHVQTEVAVARWFGF